MLKQAPCTIMISTRYLHEKILCLIACRHVGPHFWEGSSFKEMATYIDGEKNTPLTLKKGQKLGFAIAYCDNDRSPERENFIGNVFVAGEDKNQGYKTADIFAKLELK